MTPRERLEEMLAEKGYAVTQSITIPQGHYRTSKYADCYRWQAYAKSADGSRVTIDSWDTVTACIRYGFEVEKEEEFGLAWQLMAYAYTKEDQHGQEAQGVQKLR